MTRMATAVIAGVLAFEPDPGGTRMSWTWQMRPKGMLRAMGPLIGLVGRRQEAEIWAGLERHQQAEAPPAAAQ